MKARPRRWRLPARWPSISPADLRLTSGGVTVRITKKPDVAGAIVEDHAIQIPVTIDWETFA